MRLTDQVETIDVTLVCSTAAASAGDVVAITAEIPNFFKDNGSKAFITGVILYDEDDQGLDLDILLMNAATDVGTLGAANAITDAEGETIIAWFDINAADYKDWGDFRTATLKPSDTGFYVPGWIYTGSTSLWIAAITRGAPTYTVSGVKLKFSVEY